MLTKIYTYNFTSNYGAILQAFSLGNYLNSVLNSEVFFSSYHPAELKYHEFLSPMISKKPSKALGHLKKNIKIILWRNYYLKRLIKKKNAQDQRMYSIYGSDEIWNFLNPYYGFSDYYFGKEKYGKKIAYAASIGKATFQDLNDHQKQKLIVLLNNFHSISVRDDNTAEFVNKLIGKTPEIVVDPTLLSNPIFFSSSNKINSKKKYAAIYGLNFSKDEIEKIKKFCEKENLELISVGYFNSWIRNNKIGINPSEFYEYIKKSSCVFTSMFHGIVLSIKSNRNFWYTVDPIRRYKVRHIISKFNLESRNLSSAKNLEGNIDFEKINQLLDKWIKQSQNFLINSVSK
tara:strand:+ start:1482 stop:2516 length:1035 start_codon:yes stop_codon:yes gene_type:complete